MTTTNATAPAVTATAVEASMAWATSTAMAADSTVRKIVVRLIASLRTSDRDPSRLQCSVARMLAASGPEGRWPV